MAAKKARALAITMAACLAIALAACAVQSRTSDSSATETQRQAATLASEAAVEIGNCTALSATDLAHQPSNVALEPGDIADAALSQCEYLLSDYESNDRALVLAADPGDVVSFADRHAKQSKIHMSQSTRRRAVEVVLEERAKLAQQ
jgi:hypothetical protein